MVSGFECFATDNANRVFAIKIFAAFFGTKSIVAAVVPNIFISAIFTDKSAFSWKFIFDRRRMNSLVLCFGQALQIFKSVVSFVAVYVMDVIAVRDVSVIINPNRPMDSIR